VDGEGGADGGALAKRVEATASDDDDGECSGGGGGSGGGGRGGGGGGGASAGGGGGGGGEVVSLVACAHGAWVREPAVALCVAELRLEAASEQQVAGDL